MTVKLVLVGLALAGLLQPGFGSVKDAQGVLMATGGAGSAAEASGDLVDLTARRVPECDAESHCRCWLRHPKCSGSEKPCACEQVRDDYDAVPRGRGAKPPSPGAWQCPQGTHCQWWEQIPTCSGTSKRCSTNIVSSSNNATLAMGSCDTILFRVAGQAYRKLCQGSRKIFCSGECGHALAFLLRHVSTCAFNSVLRRDALMDVLRIHSEPGCHPKVEDRGTVVDLSDPTVGQPLSATGAVEVATPDELSPEEKVEMVRTRVEEARKKNLERIEEQAARSEAAREATLEAEEKMERQMAELARQQQEHLAERQRAEQAAMEEANEEAG